MKRQRFSYDGELERLKALITFQLSDYYKGANVDSDFLDYHNDTCPRCQTKLTVTNNSIFEAGSISGFYTSAARKIYMYALCKMCTNEVAIEAHRSQMILLQKAQKVESFILNKLQVV